MDRSHAARVLERLHEAQQVFYSGGRIKPLRALLTDDVTWTVPGRNAIAGTYRGADSVVGYFGRRRNLAKHTLRLDPGEILTGEGPYMARLTDGTATIGGLEHRWSTVGLYRLTDDLIAACWLLPLDLELFDRVWTAPAERAPQRD
jgi:ketosteroid isomerase-like protein